MIKCETIKKFTLNDFGKLKNVVRNSMRDKHGELYIGDTFECDKKMADYLTGGNEKKEVVAKIIEIIPDEKKANKKKKTSKK